MSQRANYTKIGVFVLMGTALLIAGLITFGLREQLQKGLVAETYFDESIQGLDVGSPVKYRGVRVGTVQDIGFVGSSYPDADDRYDRYVLVTVMLQPRLFGAPSSDKLGTELERAVREGMRIRLAPQGITGLAFLELDFLNPASHKGLDINWSPREMYIPSARNRIAMITDAVESVSTALKDSDIAELAAQIKAFVTTLDRGVEALNLSAISVDSRNLIAELRQTNANINKSITDAGIERLSAELSAAINEFRATSATTRESVELVRALVEEHRAKVGETIDSAAAAVADGRETVAAVREILARENVDASLEAFRTAAARAIQVSEKMPQAVDQLSRNLNRLEMLLAGKEEDVTAVLENLRVVSENLKDLTSLARDYPAAVIFGDAPAQMEEKP